MIKKDQVIALDGPSGSGKSTVAKLVAKKLGLIYIDTGAMFRAVAYAFRSSGIDFTKSQLNSSDEMFIQSFFETHAFKYAPSTGVLMMLDDVNLTELIREHYVSKLASQVSKHKIIRDFLAHWQREIVKDRPAILDGRDIGTVIFPNAVLKVFLTASAEERAQRRFLELNARGQENLDFQMILKDIEERDFQDMNRDIAPLKAASDSVKLDSSGKTIDEIVNDVVSLWGQRVEQK